MPKMKFGQARLRCGHAPGHIRDTFLKAIEAYVAWNSGEPEPTVTHEIHYREYEIPISKACVLVWNCTDVLPGSDIDWLRDCGVEFQRGSYAAAARALHRAITQISEG